MACVSSEAWVGGVDASLDFRPFPDQGVAPRPARAASTYPGVGLSAIRGTGILTGG